MMCRLQILLTVFVSFFALQTFAQNATERSLIQHKIRTDLVEYLEFHLEQEFPNIQLHLDEKLPSIETRSDDKSVNDTPEAESELHAAINPVDSNNIIICAMRNNPDNFLAPLTFPIYYTNDFGASWQISEFNGVGDGEFILGGGDPILVFDTEGTAYLTWLTITVDLSLEFTIELRFAESKDGGATWQEYEQPIDSGDALEVLAGGFGKFVDKEWLAVDHSDSPYRDRIYASYLTIESFEDSLAYNITLRHKTPEAIAFSDSSVVVNTGVYKIAQFTSIDVDDVGTVHVSFAASLDSLNWSLYYTQSNDGGESFRPEQKVADFHIPKLSGDEPDVNIVGISPDRLYPCPHLVVDKSGEAYNNNLYLIWTANGLASKLTEGLDIYFSSSADGGNTWSAARVLNDDGIPDSHQFYPSIAVNETGQVIASWYDRRNDPENLLTDYYITYSDDGGNTFVDAFSVSTASSDFSAIGAKNADFGIGEYTQTIASSSFGIPVWADGRDNDGNIDLYLAYVALDGSSLVNLQTISEALTIGQIAPNPFSEDATIEIELKAAMNCSMTVITTDGKLIKTIVQEKLQAGTHHFQINGLAKGTYFLEINTDDGRAVRTLMVE